MTTVESYITTQKRNVIALIVQIQNFRDVKTQGQNSAVLFSITQDY
jgi:hypothetical protein